MTATTIRVQMAQRKDTAANWTSANPILLSGEIGYETDTKKFKIGNGSSNWNSLAYLPIPDGSGNLTITGNLEIGSTGSLTFEGSTADGFETTLAVTNPTADRTITLPDRSGTVITSGDTGTVTSTMLADGTIVNDDVNAAAAIAGTKISPDFGSQTVQTTGIFSHALGSASAPTVTFTGDTNTGIYSPGADQVAISTGGSGRLFVDASGNVGIGSPSNGNRLDVKRGDNSFLARFYQEGAGLNADILINNVASASNFLISRRSSGESWVYNSGADPLVFHTNAQERLRITSAGLVGVGTSSPGKALTIQQPDGTSALRIQSSLTGETYDIYRNNVDGILQFNGNQSTGFNGFNFSTTPSGGSLTSRLFIATGGNVGIGTTSPGALLDCKVTSSKFVRITEDQATSNTGVIRCTESDGTNRGMGVAGNFIAFLQGADNTSTITERARIDSSGRLLVGTSSASTTLGALTAKFQVQGTTAFDTGVSTVLWEASNNPAGLQLVKSRGASVGTQTIVQNGDGLGRIWFGGSDGTDFETAAWIEGQVDGTPGANDMPGRLVFSTTADGASSPTERLRITQAGNTLIGSGSQISSERLGITFAAGNQGIALNVASGAAQTQILFANPNGTVGTISTSGSATAYNTSSDYRLKENVTAVADGITRLLQLKPSRFNFIADPDRTVDGFIAHEVQAVVPEAITGEKDAVDDDGNPIYQGIDQSKLVPLLTAALQEAVAKIESLETRLTAAGI